MKVVSTSGRGPNTVYTVEEDGKTWDIKGASNLPETVFKAWRKHQSSVCMSNKRTREREAKGEANSEVNEGKQAGNVEIAQRPLCEDKSCQVGSSKELMDQAKEVAQRAINLVTCKICQEAEVKRIILPCGHLVFCASCLKKWLTQQPICPICRSPINDWIGSMMIE